MHDWQRFSRPDQLAGWLGLVPSLEQSRENSHQGGITKTGSRYARRLLVESAWHYQRPPRIGVTLRNRQQDQPAHVLQIAWRAQHRLYRLGLRLRERRKPANVATVAITAVRSAIPRHRSGRADPSRGREWTSSSGDDGDGGPWERALGCDS